MSNLLKALETLETFSTNKDLTYTISEIEYNLKSENIIGLQKIFEEKFINEELLGAALLIKEVSGQINVFIHAIGILISLTYILNEDEKIESLSLGAGNTGRDFDLITDKRIAEFKFIDWKGGSEAIRQNSTFIDFFNLASTQTSKSKELYVIDKKHPIKFFKGNRSLESVLSKNSSAKEKFYKLYGNKYKVVSDYYADFCNVVTVVDLKEKVPAFKHR